MIADSIVRASASTAGAPSHEQPDRPPDTASDRRRAWLGLTLALALGAVLRGYLALKDAGIYWPDEIYQSLEPAHRLLFGYGLVPWEFIDGARSWALPGVVAGVWEALRHLGLGHAAVIHAIKLLFAAAGVATGWATYRLARAADASPLAAALAGAAFSLSAAAIYFAPRAMSETASALPATLGLAFALDPRSGSGKRILGATLLVLAVFLRLHCGIFCVGLLAIFAARRRSRELLESGAVLAVGAVLYGLLDRLTWGGWFHSAIVYLRFNLIEGRASGWHTQHALYYPQHLLRPMPLLALSAFVLAWLGARRARGLAWLTVAFLVLHSLVPHKELRFIFPLLPLWFALAGLGVDALEGSGRRWAILALALPSLWSAVRFHHLSFGELGAYPSRSHDSAYDDFGPVNRLLLRAGEQPDVCGVLVAAGLPWTGGYSYLHRPIPLYGGGKPAPSPRAYNYAIVRAARGTVAIARDGDFALVQRFSGGCAPDPHYSWRLP